MDRPAPAIALEQRLAGLRAELKRLGLTGFIVPHADEHQSEYLPPSAERLAWLTGFTGSAGMAIVLENEAAIFVDGRYTLQVRNEVDTTLFTPEHLVETPPAKWLGAHVGKGDRIGYDPWLISMREAARFAESCKTAGAELIAVAEDPLDRLWADRPSPPLGAVSLHPLAFAGRDAAAKIAELKTALAGLKADSVVLTQADSIAWLFNIRGEDIAHNPAPLAFAIVAAADRPVLFIDGRKLSNVVRAALVEQADLREPRDLTAALEELGSAKAKVLLDPATTAEALADIVRRSGGSVIEGADPVALPKARKNEVELAGSRNAHIRDGAAMVRFLAWLDDAGLSGDVDEIDVASKLAEFRKDTARRDGAELVDLSFETISGAGPERRHHPLPRTARNGAAAGQGHALSG